MSELRLNASIIRQRVASQDKQDVLWIVSEYGPVTASEVARHLNVDPSWVRARLSWLEHHAFIDAHYTHGGRGRGYVAQGKGLEALEAKP